MQLDGSSKMTRSSEMDVELISVILEHACEFNDDQEAVHLQKNHSKLRDLVSNDNGNS